MASHLHNFMHECNLKEWSWNPQTKRSFKRNWHNTSNATKRAGEFSMTSEKEEESANLNSTISTPQKDKAQKEKERFLARVKQAEELAHQSPTGYKLRVILWALVGYLYMFIVPVCLIAILALVILLAAKFSIAVVVGLKPVVATLAVAFGCYIKALWVRFEPPSGNELNRKDYPQLFAVIDKMSQQTGVSVDHVLLQRDFNASVVQYPKFGLFGFYENYLNIGLSLMLALTEKEFQSVIAHELGHLANHHSKRSAWIYSMRIRWAQIMIALHAQSSVLLVLMMRFLDWYQPRFLTLTQVIARQQEREADTLAIAIAGADAHARSFLAITARGTIMSNNAMESIYRSYPVETKPPGDVYNKFAEQISRAISEKAILVEAIETLLTEEPQPFDTHPSSAERIRSSALVTALDDLPVQQKAERLVEIFALDEAIENSAAATLFGANYQKALNTASQEWQREVAEAWAMRAEMMQQSMTRQNELNKKVTAGTELNLEERIEYANIIETLEGIEKALSYFEAILKDHPEEPLSAFIVGAHRLLTNRDEAGIPLLEIAANAGRDYCRACEILLHYFTKKEEMQKAAQYEKLLIAYYEELHQSSQEKSVIQPVEELVTHTANQEEIEELVASIKHFEEIRALYILEKNGEIQEDQRVFLLLIRMQKDPGLIPDENRQIKAQKLCNEVAAVVKCPGRFYVRVISNKDDSFLLSATRLGNALIYSKK